MARGPSGSGMRRPSDLAILTAMMLTGREWMYADEIRSALARLGFLVTTQSAAAALGRLSREETPCVEIEPDRIAASYRLTTSGWTLLGNRWRAQVRLLREVG